MKRTRRIAALVLAAAITMSPALVPGPAAADVTHHVNVNGKCGWFGGTVGWHSNEIYLQGSLVNTCERGVVSSVWLSWYSPTHHNVEVGISRRGDHYVTGLYRPSSIIPWAPVGHVHVAVCSTFLGWSCGAPQSF